MRGGWSGVCLNHCSLCCANILIFCCAQRAKGLGEPLESASRHSLATKSRWENVDMSCSELSRQSSSLGVSQRLAINFARSPNRHASRRLSNGAIYCFSFFSECLPFVCQDKWPMYMQLCTVNRENYCEGATGWQKLTYIRSGKWCMAHTEIASTVQAFLSWSNNKNERT